MKSPAKLEAKPITQLSQQPIPPYERREANTRQQVVQNSPAVQARKMSQPIRMQQQTAQPQPQSLLKKSPPQKKTMNENEPICVLKIELDGEHVEEIKVYRSDEPHELVQRFGE